MYEKNTKKFFKKADRLVSQPPQKNSIVRSIRSDAVDRICNLQNALLSDTLDAESRVDYENMLKKEMEGFVNSVHTTSIWFRESRGLWCTKIKYDGTFKTITAKSKGDLVQKLYHFYNGEGQSTVMKDLFPKMLDYKRHYHTYNDKVKEAAKYAGITDLRQIRTHSLRTTAATAAYRKCHDIKTVQALLGHTTAQMTDKYIKNLDSLERLREII